MKLHRTVLSFGLLVAGAVIAVEVRPMQALAVPPTISLQTVSVPSLIEGPVSQDGRYALVTAGSTVSVSDAVTGALADVGFTRGSGLQPVVEDMSRSGRFIVQTVRPQGIDTTLSLEVVDRVAATTHIVATGIESLSAARASISMTAQRLRGRRVVAITTRYGSAPGHPLLFC